MKFTLYTLPRSTDLHLIIGGWQMPAPPAIQLVHGTTPGEAWYPLQGRALSVYYNYVSGGFEIGKRKANNNMAEPIGRILPDNVEVCR